MKIKRITFISAILLLFAYSAETTAKEPKVISLKKGESLVMPVQDDIYEVKMIIKDLNGKVIGAPLRCGPANVRVDYYCAYTAAEDCTVSFDGIEDKAIFFDKYYVTDKEVPMANPKPELHYRPRFGWMNDPNGSFYHNGVWHLYFQHNFTHAQGLNQCWGHAVSKDLYSWEQCDVALYPDSMGNIWSGTCVVDENNVAGFGADAVLAFYTPTTTNDYRQCIGLAYSNDGGMTFTKYSGNPVIGYRDTNGFRDPKVMWCEKAGKWLLIATRDLWLDVYASDNLKDWTLWSTIDNPFGKGSTIGLECPDLFPVKYGDKEKWVLLVSTPGKPGVDYAVAYSIGDFDGKNFTSETDGWVDYGFEFYAAQTFNHAAEPTMIAWACNWKYLYQEPAVGIGYRGECSVPRRLFLTDYAGKLVLGSYPVESILTKGKSYMEEKEVDQGATIKIGDATYTFNSESLAISRGSENTTAPLEQRAKHKILIIRHERLTEIFIDGGAIALTNRDRVI